MTRLLLFFLTITCSYQLACCQSLVFQIGTKWVYEVGMGYDPVAVAPLVYEITDTILLNDTTAWVVQPRSSEVWREYLYQQGDSIFFWDASRQQFQLHYDFSATDRYETSWRACSGRTGVANIVVDSLTQLNLVGGSVGVQHLRVENSGTTGEDMPVTLYHGIGAAERLSLQLGWDVCDVFWGIIKLRCFESGGEYYNFAGYPCDTTFYLTSTTSPPAASAWQVYPNPTTGVFQLSGEWQAPLPYTIYELTGREVQSGTTEDGLFQLAQPGLYYLVVYTPKQPEVLKFLVR